ncbi:non-ribosomal peptide synthetase [Streptomyces sp. SID9727]|uniref:non-ribosomal peptide synthetase n=1 Tax=Streptomyces sp. SID9727 TaxID=2706114 RepID=UPI0013C7CADD|nr:non-ribosomal peptide synthetase [Streptomyces sp. SID9727]NEC66313.1 amino acid adenylation domain-containing protein [Streptomyces sp. SID9727]
MTEPGKHTDPAEFLARLAQHGVRLRLVDGERIEVRAAVGQLSDGIRRELAERKAELIGLLKQGDAAALPQIVPDEDRRHEPFPPSDLQMSFLVGSSSQFEYHVRPHQYMEFDFAELDPERFETALGAMLHRQRGSLVVVRDDLQLETVRDPAPVKVRVTDVRQAPDAEAQAVIERTRDEMQAAELPLDTWPWMDVRITRYGDGRARLHYNNNNFFSDGPGTGRFLDSVLASYHEPSAALPELQLGYRDCVLALAALEESERGEASRKYWCDRMADWPQAPDLPLVTGADTRSRAQLTRREFTLTAAQWSRFKQHATDNGVTATNAVYAVYAEIVAYWSGSRHFLLNNMMTHRLPLHPQITEVVGNFASLYPLEVDWRHDEAFRDRAGRLQTQVMTDVEHTYWSGVKVLQQLNQVRRTPGKAACPFVVGSGLFMGHLDQPVFSHLETPQVLLDNQFWEQSDGGLWVVWDLIESMFPAGLIDAMHTAYRELLLLLAEDPAAWARSSFDLLPAEQRARRAAVNDTGRSVPEGLLGRALPQQAGRRPGASAVVAADGTLDYAQLRERAQELAALLHRNGVRPADCVAVLLPKGAEQIAAVHGVLAARAAYVPIDPGWPRERVGELLADARVTAVLTSEAERDSLVPVAGCPVLATTQATAVPGPPAVPEGDPGDTAYVIYTSGSSGKPKGAMLDHTGPLNTVVDINRRFAIGPDDVVFGVSSLCFDLSVYDVFGTAEAGATLLLPPPGTTDPGQWADLVQEHGVTVWNSVPALMQLFAEAAEQAGLTFPALRVVLLSGDWIPVQLPALIGRIAPHARVVSLGGATEASIWSIHHPIDRVDPDWASIPYGRPLGNQHWRVRDAVGRDAPDRVTGDLYIGGTGVALGYLNDPDRTAASFVTDPVTGERLYRTGDLGRYLPDGDIEFLGRADFQVKIQGFRVEPGEIEHALAQHPAVRHAVVVARTAGSGRQLAGYVVAEHDAPRPRPEELIAHLADRLPGHLVPSFVVVLDALPLTANGKLDRRAIEAIGPTYDDRARTHTPPGTETEKALVEIWESVLGVDRIGIHDDFFDLGGQSFAALRVIGMVGTRLGLRAPLGALLERRTVAALAELLEQDTGQDTWSPLVALDDTGEGTPWALVHPAGGNVLCYRGLAELLDGPCHAFQAPGPGVGRQPLDTVEALAECYAEALLAVRPHGPYRVAGWSSGGVIAFELARLLEQRGETVERLVVIDSPAPERALDQEASGTGATGGTERADGADEAAMLLWFLEDLDVGFDPAAVRPSAAAELAAAPEPERLARAVELARAQGLEVPEAADLALSWPVFRGVITACHRYRARTVAADVTVVRAAHGRVSEFEGHPHTESAEWGWAPLTGGRTTAATTDGTHHTLLTGAHVAAVAALMTTCPAQH